MGLSEVVKSFCNIQNLLPRHENTVCDNLGHIIYTQIEFRTIPRSMCVSLLSSYVKYVFTQVRVNRDAYAVPIDTNYQFIDKSIYIIDSLIEQEKTYIDQTL